MFQTILAIFLILHGLVHLLWFVVPWNLMEVDGLPYSTKIFAGRVDVGAGGIRVLGLLWVLATIGFIVAGVGLLFSASWWWAASLGAALFSFLLCILGLPDSKWGGLIDIITLLVLLVGKQYGLSFLPFSLILVNQVPGTSSRDFRYKSSWKVPGTYDAE